MSRHQGAHGAALSSAGVIAAQVGTGASERCRSAVAQAAVTGGGDTGSGDTRGARGPWCPQQGAAGCPAARALLSAGRAERLAHQASRRKDNPNLYTHRFRCTYSGFFMFYSTFSCLCSRL